MGSAVIGVDVGGTNTDAVLVEGRNVVGYAKHVTTTDRTTGVIGAISGAIKDSLSKGLDGKIVQINIGTTHFINAVVQRKNLSKVAVIRLCGPYTKSLPPFTDFPTDLAEIIRSSTFMLNGGYQYDGSEITPIDFEEVSQCLDKIHQSGIRNILIVGTFSSVRAEQELCVRDYILQNYGDFSVTVSHEIGSMNLLERENASILNESLKSLCHRTIKGFEEAFRKLGLNCPVYFTQNDGTIISTALVWKFPIFTFASGSTNSMRGAVLLTGIEDGIVIDIGGTSTDVGVIQSGFPREASIQIKIGGVSTNFRMPDIVSIGLGGGSIIKTDRETSEVSIGPISVNKKLTTTAQVFGGQILTATDVTVAAGLADVGDKNLVSSIDREFVAKCVDKIHSVIEDLVDRVKISSKDCKLIVVGGGSIILDMSRKIKGISDVIRPQNYFVANAVGAALSQIGGTFDGIFAVTDPKEDFLEIARRRAVMNALESGAAADTIKTVQELDVNLLYLPGTAKRVKVKVVGDIDRDASQRDQYGEQLLLSSLQISDDIASTGVDLYDEDSNDYGNCDGYSEEKTLEPSEPYINPITKEWELSKWDAECISVGAGILGCGGGGNPYLARLILLKLLDDGKTVRIVHPDRLQKNVNHDYSALMVFFYGAPSVMNENIYSGGECTFAANCLEDLRQLKIRDQNFCEKDYFDVKEENYVKFVENYTLQSNPKSTGGSESNDGCKIGCVCSVEIGGMNAIEPLIFGATNDLPVADVDGIGRAVPEVQMICPFIYGVHTYPMILANALGMNNMVLYGKSCKDVEDHFRKSVINFGCAAGAACREATVGMLKYFVPASMSRSWIIGNSILRSRLTKQCAVENLVEQQRGKIIITGKVLNVNKMTTGGFDRGTVTIVDSSGLDEIKVIVDVQNEYLVASKISKNEKIVIGSVPDLITIVESDTCMPISSDLLEYGQRVTVLLLPPPAMICTEEVLEYVGPKAFGYPDIKYQLREDFVAEEVFIPPP